MDDIEVLRGALIAGIALVCGLCYYLIHLTLRTMGKVKIVPVIVSDLNKNGPMRGWLHERHLLDLIKDAHKGCGWDYTWVGPIHPRGEVVFAWREWVEEGTSLKDRALDVMFVKPDGSVETIAVGVENEVFGDPEGI